MQHVILEWTLDYKHFFFYRKKSVGETVTGGKGQGTTLERMT